MSIEGIRLPADWLAGAVEGCEQYALNAQLATVPRWPGDPAPPAVVVRDMTRSSIAARAQAPAPGDRTPTLMVRLYEQELEGETLMAPRDSDLTLVLLYHRRNPVPAEAVRDALYTFRAALRSLEHFHQDEFSAHRYRHGVELVALLGAKLVPVEMESDDLVRIGLVLKYHHRFTEI